MIELGLKDNSELRLLIVALSCYIDMFTVRPVKHVQLRERLNNALDLSERTDAMERKHMGEFLASGCCDDVPDHEGD